MIARMPQDVSRYFSEGQKKLNRVVPSEGHVLILYYSDGTVRSYSLANQLTGVFKYLKDPEVFNRVFIDEYGSISWDIDPAVDSSVHWNNRIDICPDAAYMDSEIIRVSEQ